MLKSLRDQELIKKIPKLLSQQMRERIFDTKNIILIQIAMPGLLTLF